MISEKSFERGQYLVYVETVRKLTEKNVRKYWVDNKDKRSTEWHLDHKVSIKECYENNILPEYAAHLCNLEVVPQSYNSKKNSKSSMTPSELIAEIVDCDSYWDNSW